MSHDVVTANQKGFRMKNMILASIFALGFSAFAQEGAEPAPAAEQKVEKKEVRHEKKGGKHHRVEKKVEHKESAE